MEIEKWLENIISGLVSDNDAIEIVKTTDEMGVLYTLKVAKSEAGKVIGKSGNTVQAIRTLLHAVGLGEGMRASLKIDMPKD